MYTSGKPLKQLLAPLLNKPMRVQPPFLLSNVTRGEPESPGQAEPAMPLKLSKLTAHNLPQPVWAEQPLVREPSTTCKKNPEWVYNLNIIETEYQFEQ